MKNISNPKELDEKAGAFLRDMQRILKKHDISGGKETDFTVSVPDFTFVAPMNTKCPKNCIPQFVTRPDGTIQFVGCFCPPGN